MRLPLPRQLSAGFAGLSRPAQAAIWQLPLVGLLSLEIGAVLTLFWGGGILVSSLSRRWQRWYVQLALILALLAITAMVLPVKSAEFFITLMVAVLPMTWQLEGQLTGQPEGQAEGQDDGKYSPALSPAGLTPTIFLVGTVFLFQIQFFVLLLVVVWLLAFLAWFCMALTGFRLETLSLRWLPVMLISAGVAGLIVALFIAVPRVSTGFIPGFATQQQRIALTDEIAPGGMRDLLADETVAFRAVPDGSAADVKARYWRVFVLDSEAGGRWQRGAASRPVPVSRFAAHEPEFGYALLLDDHDPATLPVPGWPAGFSGDYRYSLNGELIATPLANPRRMQVAGASSPPALITPPDRPALSDANPRLVAWAEQTRASLGSDSDFADLVLRRFADGFSYDTTLDLPAEDALDSFFFEVRRGYCAYFATAMATALRAAGIEANIVMGYSGGIWNEFGEFWTLRNADAHAWVEARLDGGNWQRIDPTMVVRMADSFTGSLLQAAPVFVDTTDSGEVGLLGRLRIAGQWVDALNTRITIAIMDYGLGGSSSASVRDNAAFVFLGIGLAMTGVVTVGALLALRRGRPQHRLERRFERLLADAGAPAPRQPGETLITYAARRGASFDNSAGDLSNRLAAAITESRFSPQASIDHAVIIADLRQLRRLIGTGPVRRHLLASFVRRQAL